MTAALHVSASSLRLLNDCPRAWWYCYACGYVGESQSSSTVLGRAVHAALAGWYTALRDGAALPSVEAMHEVARRVIAELAGSPIPIDYGDGEDVDTVAAESGRLIAAFDASPFRPSRIIAIEQLFTLALKKHPVTGEVLDVDEVVSGVFDLVAEDNDGNLVVVDHTTGKRRPSVDGGFDLQMALYSWAARQLFGRDAKLAHQVILRTKVATVALHALPANEAWEAEAVEAVASGVALVNVAVEHPQPLRLMGRRRSWRCEGCAYRRRCAQARS